MLIYLHGRARVSADDGENEMKLPTTVEDRMLQALADRVATDPDGSYLTRSNGRRKAGRPTKYYLHRPGKMPQKIEAYTDEEAIEIVNS